MKSRDVTDIERYDRRGLMVESVTMSANAFSDGVHLTIQGEKRVQHFHLTNEQFTQLISPHQHLLTEKEE